MDAEVKQALEEIRNITLLGVKKFLTVDDAALLTGYSRAYVVKLCQKGTLSYSQPGGRTIYIEKSELEEYMAQGYVKGASKLARERQRDNR